MSGLTMEDFEDCIATGPMPGEVGHTGDIEELREYPCNCFTCRGEPNAVAREYGDCFHDGEMTWWQCVFCRRFFDLEDLELMSGDTQGCEPCTGAWYASLREMAALHQVPSIRDGSLPIPDDYVRVDLVPA